MAESLLKRVKAKDHELLSDENIKKVIDLLEGESPITKKAACEILNISYNTTRLGTIVENYKAKKAKEAEFRAKNRGKPATEYEIKTIIEDSLAGDPKTDIAKRLYRPLYFVENIIERCQVPRREPGATFFDNVPLIPEDAVKHEFKLKEKVYSARYQSLAVIDHILVDAKKQTVYRIFLLDDDLQHSAYQPWWELASLEHLKQYGVNV